MQQDTDFITADFLYMFRASSAHHQEYKILTRQPPVLVVMVAVIKSASCCITSVFYLTLYYDARKHKSKISESIPSLRVCFHDLMLMNPAAPPPLVSANPKSETVAKWNRQARLTEGIQLSCNNTTHI
jgi:hypothetical protein